MEKFTFYSLRKRILTFTVLISFIFLSLILRLGVVQIIHGADLQHRAHEQWIRDLPLTAKRGTIYDTTGAPLAVSVSTYNVYSRAREIAQPAEVAKQLSLLLKVEYSALYNKLTYTSVSEVLLGHQIDHDVAHEIIDLNFKGIYLSENIKRYYPYGDLLTQVLGFTTTDNHGQAGIEQYYNNYLKGVDGFSYIQSDLTGRELENTLRDYVPAIAGMDIALTVDSKIQLEVEKALEKVMIEQKAKSATAIVMNPNNGEILAMSTKPSFDLNNVPRDNVANLMETVKNKSVVDVYEPGSTFKILTMASALEENVVTHDNHYYCPGYTIVDGEKIKCWKSTGHGSQTLAEGFANSCNVVFVQLGLALGKEKFYSRLGAYEFGKQTGVEISGESGGIIMNKGTAKNVDLARMGFGQAVAVTPLQLISSVAAVVNGGTLYQPKLIKSITAPNNNVVYSSSTTPKKQVVRQQVSSAMNVMLEDTVSKPGKYTFIPGYEMGGKTGTTQKYENGKISGKYISSFVGTFPASNPKYIVLVVVDEPGTGQYYGSIVASPYAIEIFKGIFKYKNIEPTHLSQALESLKQEVEMPALVGKSLAQAQSQLIKLGLQYEVDGDGGIVTEQLPPAGTMIPKNTTIVISTR